MAYLSWLVVWTLICGGSQTLPHVAMVVSKQHLCDWNAPNIYEVLTSQRSKCSTFKDQVPLIPHSATAARQAQPVSPVNARVSVRTGHASRAGALRVATAPMRACYGSHIKYAPRKPSHRTSRDPPERGFYKLRPANKTDHLCQSWQ